LESESGEVMKNVFEVGRFDVFKYVCADDKGCWFRRV
jgi:hypothetical protein